MIFAVSLLLLTTVVQSYPFSTTPMGRQPSELRALVPSLVPGHALSWVRGPASSMSRGTTSARPPLSRAPRAYGVGSITQTLDLINDTLLPGSYPILGCEDPNYVLPVVSLGKLFLSCAGHQDDFVANLSTGALLSAIPTGGSPGGPDRSVYDPSNGCIYQSMNSGVDIINLTADAVQGMIPVGSSPQGIALDSGSGDLYVTDGGSNNVTIISTATNQPVGAILVGSWPDDAIYDSRTNAVYVANSGSNTVSVIDAGTSKVISTTPVGSAPSSLIFDPASGSVYVANYNSGSVSIVNDTNRSVVGTVVVGASPEGLAYIPTSQQVFVGHYDSTAADIIDGVNGTLVKTLHIGWSPMGASFDAANGLLYVANSDSNNLTEILGSSDTIVANVLVGTTYPDAVAYDGGDGEVYVAESNTGIVDAVNDTTNTVAAKIPVGTGPVGLSYDPQDGRVYVANLLSKNLTVIDGATNKAVGSVGLTYPPEALAYDGANGRVYVACFGNGNTSSGLVAVVDTTTDNVVANVSMNAGIAISVAYDALNGYVYAGGIDGSSDIVDVIDPTSNSVVKTLYPNDPEALVVDTSDGDIYVAEASFGQVGVINGTTNSLVTTITALNNPWNLAYDSDNHLVYAGDPGAGHESAINGTNLVTTLPVPLGPEGAVYDPNNAVLYVADGAGAVSLISTSYTPYLSALSVTPPTAALLPGDAANFSALATCAGGACPSGTSYSWSLTNGLATLHSSTGNPVEVTAGYTAGVVSLFVNATLNNVTKEASANITIKPAPGPTLVSVSVTPSAATVAFDGTQPFSAILSCNGGACPTGATFAWKLNNSLGTLNSTVGSPIQFRAGNAPGVVQLLVNATLDGRSATGYANITIVSHSSPAPRPTTPPTFLGLPVYEGYLVLVGLAAAVAIVTALLVMRRRKNRAAQDQTAPPPT